MEQLKEDIYDLFDIDIENAGLQELEDNLIESEDKISDIDYEKDDILSEYSETIADINLLEDELSDHIMNLEEKIRELNSLPRRKEDIELTELLKYIDHYMFSLNKGLVLGGAKDKIHVMLMEALYGKDIFNWISNKGGN